MIIINSIIIGDDLIPGGVGYSVFSQTYWNQISTNWEAINTTWN